MPLFKPPTTEKTRSFYRDLQDGKRNPLFWGTKRFDTEKSLSSKSLKKHFQAVIDQNIQPSDKVLDVGCGSGLFLPAIHQRSSSIWAVDTSQALLDEAESLVTKYKLEGITVQAADVEALPFETEFFDSLVVVDVLHHFENLHQCIEEMWRVLKPGGKLIILEPNKLNPLLAFGCLLDRNEWGLLALGRRGLYRQRLQTFFEISTIEFNGLIIGPDDRWMPKIANFVTRKPWSRVLSWLAPKILVLADKPHT